MNCNNNGSLILKKGLFFLHSFMRNALLFCFFLGWIFPAYSTIPDDALSTQQAPVKPALFTENKGQMTDMDGNPVPFVLFRQESGGMNFYITDKGLTYAFLNWRKEPKQNLSEAEKEEELRNGKIKKQKFLDWARIDMELEGAHIARENVIVEKESAGSSQYFLGHCPDGITGVKSYEKITFKEVYPGIDWVFYNSTEKGVKYDFIVHPGADPAQIRLLYSSKEKLDLDAQGNIQIRTAHGNLTESAPETFQDGKLIESKFKIISQVKNKNDGYDNLIAIELPTLSLKGGAGGGCRIDPQLYWATFFGGTGFDGPRSVVTDNNGNVFVTGYTESGNFPTQTGSGYYQGTAGGGIRDMFFQKFNNAGARLWATYYGGNLTDEGWHLAVDNANNVFVIGYTESANFPTQTAGTFFQGTYGGQGDAFILKFDNNGNRLWATYYGGVNMEEGFGITTDPTGNIFLTGETRSATTFPLLNPGGGAFYQGTFGTGVSDAFILKFDNAGNRLWSTFAGGWNTDMGNAITTDAAGNVFVTGYAWGGGFPVLNAGTFFQGAVTGSGDVFIMKFSNAGVMLWSTYYGGGAVDEGNSIVTDASGNVFVTGTTASGTFPTQNAPGAYFQGTKGGTWDTYLLKFDNQGNRLWATFFGGSSFEAYKEYTFDNLDVDDCGNIYMSVETESSDVPTQASCDNGYFDNSYNGGVWDIFLAQFSNTGAYLWGTYLGGDGGDFRSPIDIDNQNNLFVSGEWTDNASLNPATYPLTNPGGSSFNNSFTGGHDGFMTKFIKPVPTMSITTVNASCGCTGSATANPAGICAPYVYQWSNGQTTQTITGLCAGTYSVFVGNSLCGTVTGTASITAAGAFTVTPTTAPATCLSTNGSATVTTTGGATPFTYVWSPTGGSSSAASGLSPGNYTVTVTDANGCSVVTPFTITSSGGPTLTLSNQTNVLCNGAATGTADMTASGGTSPYTYSWSPSGGTASTATGLSAGTYTVMVTDMNACLQTQTVTITEPPAITTTLSSTPSSCGNNSGTASVIASGGTGSYTYLWNPSAAATANVTGLSAGNYTLTVTDANGCSVSNTVLVASTGSVSAVVNPFSVCPGQTATLTASGGTTYLWSTGASTSVITATVTATTTYTVIVSQGACVDTALATITVNPIPAANAGANQTVCIGSPVTLTATGGGTYQWNTGASSSSITVAATAAATYSVLVTNSGGCTNTASVSVFVTPSIVANAGPDQTICVGGSASLTSSGGTGYNWSPSSGLSDPTIYNPVATPGSTTTYTVLVTSGSCTPATAVVTVVVTPGPIAIAASNVTITAGQIVTLTASGGGTYTWSHGGSGSPVVVAPPVTTVYCVTVTDASGCSDTSCVTVYVEATNCSGFSTEDAFVLPSAFSPNADGQNDKWRMLYPPALADCIQEFNVAVYSRWGELVFESISLAFAWDGTYQEETEGTAVFAYYVNATMKDGTKIKKKGNVSLLR